MIVDLIEAMGKRGRDDRGLGREGVNGMVPGNWSPAG